MKTNRKTDLEKNARKSVHGISRRIQSRTCPFSSFKKQFEWVLTVRIRALSAKYDKSVPQIQKYIEEVSKIISETRQEHVVRAHCRMSRRCRVLYLKDTSQSELRSRVWVSLLLRDNHKSWSFFALRHRSSSTNVSWSADPDLPRQETTVEELHSPNRGSYPVHITWGHPGTNDWAECDRAHRSRARRLSASSTVTHTSCFLLNLCTHLCSSDGNGYPQYTRSFLQKVLSAILSFSSRTWKIVKYNTWAHKSWTCPLSSYLLLIWGGSSNITKLESTVEHVVDVSISVNLSSWVKELLRGYVSFVIMLPALVVIVCSESYVAEYHEV